jgi:hypothetical protein
MSEKCLHSHLRMRVLKGQPFYDSNVILMTTVFACEACGLRFRTIGAHDGVVVDRPSTIDNGATTVLPLVPVGEEPELLAVGWS